MKLPQVTYRPVERITQGVGAITSAADQSAQQQGLIRQATSIFQEAYTAHQKTEFTNKAIEAAARLQDLENAQTADAARNIDPQELRAHGIPTDADKPVKGSIYAAPLFEKKAEALRDEILKSTPAMFRNQMATQLGATITARAERVFNKAASWKRDEDIADYTKNYDTLIKSGMYQEARNLTKFAEDSGTISAQDSVKQIDAATTAEALAPVQQLIAGDKVEPIQDEITRLQSKDYTGPLDEKTRQAAITSLQQRERQLKNDQDKIVAENQMVVFGDMEVGVSYGNGNKRLGPVHIEAAYISKQISASQRAQLMMQYHARLKAEEKAGAGLVDVQDAIANGVRLSHSNKGHVKGVDEFVKPFGTSISAQLGDDKAKDVFEQGNTIAAKHGILSKEGQAYLVGMNRSDDPAKVVRAANWYAQLAEVAPQTLTDVPERDRVRLEVTGFFAKMGVPATVAARYGAEAANRSKDEREEIRRNYAASIRDDGDSNAVNLDNFLASDNQFDPWFGAPAKASGQLRNEYDRLVGSFYEQTGDLKLAREMSQNRIKATYGRSMINGEPQALKYSPEMMTGRESEDLRAELETQVAGDVLTTASALAGAGEVKIDPKKVIVTSDSRTGRDGRYALQILRPDGMLDNLYTKDGRLAYWSPLRGREHTNSIVERARAADRQQRPSLGIEEEEDAD